MWILSGIRTGTLQFNDTTWSPTKLGASEHLSIDDTSKARLQIHWLIGFGHASL
jgi:hypothetical protein